MRVGSGKIKKEGLFAFSGEECPGLFRHLHGITGIAFQVSLETENFFGRDMILSDMPGTVACLCEVAG